MSGKNAVWKEAQHLKPVAKVAIVSDTHGFLDPRVAELVAASHIAVHAGDIGCAAVLEALQPRTGLVIAVRGNNDMPGKWAEEEQAVLSDLPLEATVYLPGGLLAVVHGDRMGRAAKVPERLRRLYPQARAVVYGHSHRVMCNRDESPWILNAGASGRTRTFGGPSCLLLHAGRRGWEVEMRRFEPLPRKR